MARPSASQIMPNGPTPPRPVWAGACSKLHPRRRDRRRVKRWRRYADVVLATYHIFIWGSVVTLVACQFTCILWDTMSTPQYVKYGAVPEVGAMAKVDGRNDDPLTDRGLVCMSYGRVYKPLPLNDVLASAQAHVIDTTGTNIVGHRVIERHELEMPADILKHYENSCNVVAATLPRMVAACAAMGFNVTTDNLRVTLGETTTRIHNSLPALIMPYWDNAIFSRILLPGHDGMTCSVGLNGAYDSPTETKLMLNAIPRDRLTRATPRWLGVPHGVWRNGWFEDPVASHRWYAFAGSTQVSDPLGLFQRRFDMLTGQELDCVHTTECQDVPIKQWWDTQFMATSPQLWFNSVAILDENRVGFFLFESRSTRIVRSIYDVATFVSNTTIFSLLARWMVAMLALRHAYERGHASRWVSPGLGSLSGAYDFLFFPLLLLPRMRIVLAAFFTAGCIFEGEQMPFAEAWFAIYPSIAEAVVLYFSLLNLLAKLVRRRVSDVGFGPTLLFFCSIHYLRREVVDIGWFELDGRIASVITASAFRNMNLFDLFTTDAALKLNGNVRIMFATKLGVLALNLLPLLVALLGPSTTASAAAAAATDECMVERALAVRACHSHGLGEALRYEQDDEDEGDGSAGVGSSTVRAFQDCDEAHGGNDKATEAGQTTPHQPREELRKQGLRDARAPPQLPGYELVRLGYVVYGGAVVISVTDWFLLAACAHPSWLRRATGYYVFVLPLEAGQRDGDDHGPDGAFVTVSRQGQLRTLYDKSLVATGILDFAAIALS